jgi:UDP-N-acetylglucosamine 3-dehydrogenase
MKNSLRIAIIGMGGMGKLYWDNLSLIKGCSVTAIVSTSANREEVLKRGAKLYETLDALLLDGQLDIACVCTPTYLHEEQIEVLLRHKIHVIAEKPLTLHRSTAERLFRLAEEQNVRLLVAQVVRFSFVSKVLTEIVKDKRYGRPLDASFLRLSARPYWSKNQWAYDLQKSGHVPFDLHIHDLDLIVGLFGKPKEYSYTGCGNADKPYKEHCRFLYKFDGFNAAAEAAWYNAPVPFTANWRVYFENAVVESNGTNVVAYAWDSGPVAFEPPAAPAIQTGINVPATSMYLDELTHFIDCVRENRPSDVVSNSDVLAVIGILEQMTGLAG